MNATRSALVERLHATGLSVEALVLVPLKMVGRHRGRVVVRTSGRFRVGKWDGTVWKYCRILLPVVGYDYWLQKKEAALPHQQ